jgi:hypothetical protein
MTAMYICLCINKVESAVVVFNYTLSKPQPGWGKLAGSRGKMSGGREVN